jgi:hypothetical protein
MPFAEYWPNESDAAYIAHLHPARALELVAHIRAVEAERDVLQRRANHLSDFVDLVVHNSLDPLTREKAKLAREKDQVMCADHLPKEDAR